MSADTGNSQQIAEGKALFAVGCASCHGLNGEGQVSGPIQGPPLAGVGAAAVDFQVSTGRMPMARPGPQAPVKPNLYSDEEIAALAAYVASLGPGPGHPGARTVRHCEPERRGSGTWRRAVPYQLLRLPQLRRCRWRTPRRQVRAPADRLGPRADLSGDVDWAAADAGLR